MQKRTDFLKFKLKHQLIIQKKCVKQHFSVKLFFSDTFSKTPISN